MASIIIFSIVVPCYCFSQYADIFHNVLHKKALTARKYSVQSVSLYYQTCF
ncbi:hypothetical protein P20480_0062 [Pseudoalteromonas sp. BSi20480]|nr:hypothetical protein P20480_0062 [Pseudoalteromonas sp. BSi20480]